MRLKSSDLILLSRIQGALIRAHEYDLAEKLALLLHDLEVKRAKTREDNRIRAAKNRKAGYLWNSSIHPSRSKYPAIKSNEKEGTDND